MSSHSPLLYFQGDCSIICEPITWARKLKYFTLFACQIGKNDKLMQVGHFLSLPPGRPHVLLRGMGMRLYSLIVNSVHPDQDGSVQILQGQILISSPVADPGS
jgi:hypothetical protein